MSGGLRYNESDKFPFPFHRGAYVIMVSFEQGELGEKQYYYSEESKRFAQDCEKMELEGIPFKLYGVWHGKYSTDIFVLKWTKMRLLRAKHSRQQAL